MFKLGGGLPCLFCEPSLLIPTHVEHMCGVGWVGGVGCLKTLWLYTLNTRGTYVWGGWVGGVRCSKTLWLYTLNTGGTYVWGGVGWVSGWCGVEDVVFVHVERDLT